MPPTRQPLQTILAAVPPGDLTAGLESSLTVASKVRRRRVLLQFGRRDAPPNLGSQGFQTGPK